MLHWGEVQLLRFGSNINRSRLCPFGLAQMDNGEVAFVGIIGHSTKKEQPTIGFSRDSGATWGDLKLISESIMGRPMMLAYLGNGKLTFVAGWQEGDKPVVYRFFSQDYGRTWPERVPHQTALNGDPFHMEGNPLLERNDSGSVKRIAEIGYNYPKGQEFPKGPSLGMLRWSEDGGKTWINETQPGWQWEEEHRGKTYMRGTGEGSLVRAGKGWLVAALRTDMPAGYFEHRNDDSLMGTGVSISKDGGKTWSPIKMIFEPGRHHAHLLRMPNNDLVMTVIVRDDVQNGRLARYRRGCDALVSHDNGLT